MPEWLLMPASHSIRILTPSREVLDLSFLLALLGCIVQRLTVSENSQWRWIGVNLQGRDCSVQVLDAVQ